ncbi:MAG TPA: VWA domain-containing protein [Pyrinomonadaceae bacterium]|nr:VWA domain-containing protein [Pyrinomonadaceae bacterium]
MKLSTFTSIAGTRRTAAGLFGIVAVFSLLISGASRAQQPDSRPRTTQPASSASPSPPQTSQPSPTPAPPTLPGRRIAPQLGEPPPPPILKPKPTPTPDPAGAVISEGDILKFNAELVTLHVRVIDRNNHPINNIAKDDFKIFEDGVPQPVFSFTQEEVPVIYGLAVDTSGSLRSQLNQVIDAAKTIINSNKRGDETFLERFIDRDKIENLQDFTSNKDLLLDAVENLYVEGGQTAVIDGIYLAAEHVAEYKKGSEDDRRRRALIVVTDGEDRASYYNESQLFQRLREEDVQIYVIGFVTELDADKGFIRKSPREKAVNLLNRIASETGGRAFYPQSISELPQVANEIVRDLRTQYVVSYDPTNKAHDGTYRAIKVVVTDVPGQKRIALTRSGRTAGLGTVAKPAPKTTASPANNNARQPTNNNPTRKSP